MSKNKGHRQIIDQVGDYKCMTEAYGLRVTKLNYYCWRINHEEDPTFFFDWYHTSGALVLNNNGAYSRVGTVLNVEEVALKVQAFFKKHNE